MLWQEKKATSLLDDVIETMLVDVLQCQEMMDQTSCDNGQIE